MARLEKDDQYIGKLLQHEPSYQKWLDRSLWPIARISRFVFPTQSGRHCGVEVSLPPQSSFTSSGYQLLKHHSAVSTEHVGNSSHSDSSSTNISYADALRRAFGLPLSRNPSKSTAVPLPEDSIRPPHDTGESSQNERGPIVTKPMKTIRGDLLSNWQRLCVTIILVVVVFAIAMVAYFVVRKSQEPQNVTSNTSHLYDTSVQGTYHLKNQTYTIDLNDLQSNRSRRLTKTFCDGIYTTLNDQATNNGSCSVTNLRNGSVFVDYILHFAGRVSDTTKDSIFTALETASGLKGLEAEFESVNFCETRTAEEDTTTAEETPAENTATVSLTTARPEEPIVTTDTNAITTSSGSNTTERRTANMTPYVCPSFIPSTCLYNNDFKQHLNVTCSGSEYFRCCSKTTYMRFHCNEGNLWGHAHQNCTGTCADSTDCTSNPCE